MVSLSSDLILACANRGIKIFFNNFNTFSAVHSLYEHKSVQIRQNQFEVCQSHKCVELARKIIIGKLKNQRATLLYSSRKIQDRKKDEIIDFFDQRILQLKKQKRDFKRVYFGL